MLLLSVYSTSSAFWKYWGIVATKDVLVKLNLMHNYVSLHMLSAYLSILHSLLSVQFLLEQTHYPTPRGGDGEPLSSQKIEF